ncbi:hypothetical protein [Pseudomonas sp. NBRC 111123]|uniref:hypothetical protein n=1 Tax=Pseudomonas sp. NBRC 111123 TaxID=1661038 RepID=UPI0015A54ABE|nr:hypothetical protein [Pseudomonas sp. NBRC 111123]
MAETGIQMVHRVEAKAQRQCRAHLIVTYQFWQHDSQGELTGARVYAVLHETAEVIGVGLRC